VNFTVYGKPEPQGSSKAFVRGGRAVITSANPNLHEWRTQAGYAARSASDGILLDGPVLVHVSFYVSRPKSRPKRDVLPDRKPDVDKLSRALLDAITGVLIRDDAQVCELLARKWYVGPGESPRAVVTVEELA
jgi:crossover junction endodeoxyribonuclease RusA